MLIKLLKIGERKSLVTQLEELRANTDFEKREAEFAKAIEEVETEDQRSKLEEQINLFEKERKAHEEQVRNLEDQIKGLDEEISKLEEEDQKINQKLEEEEKEKGEEEPTEKVDEPTPKEELRYMRNLFTTRQVLENHVKRDDVKAFIQRMKDRIQESRGVKEADILIPQVTLDLLRENLEDYSKLLKYVNLRQVPGKSRQLVFAGIPEAVWTEACGTLNELDFGYSLMELDGYKVGGFVPVCNAVLEDADPVNLYNEILEILAAAIGLAVDKAILYGTGKKMPLGIVTRLAQSSKPSDYSAKQRPWENLGTSNIQKVTKTKAAEFFADLARASKAAKNKFAKNKMTWVMNESTRNELIARGISISAAGAIVTGINDTMPVLGGDILTYDFIPDGDIICGYFENYLLAEREGGTFAVSEHVQFIEDNTVFKGTARYDGAPSIAEAFLALNINGAEVTKSLEFAPDKANDQKGDVHSGSL